MNCLRIMITHNNLLKNLEELIILFQCTIRILKLYKTVNELSPEEMKEVFPFNENTAYDTINKRKFHSRAIKSVTFETPLKRYPALKKSEKSLSG